MSFPMLLVFAGILLAFGAFIFALINMLRAIGNDRPTTFASALRGHIGAMIAMAIGGFLIVIGVVAAIAPLLTR